jgi:hypothetical protein
MDKRKKSKQNDSYSCEKKSLRPPAKKGAQLLVNLFNLLAINASQVIENIPFFADPITPISVAISCVI